MLSTICDGHCRLRRHHDVLPPLVPIVAYPPRCAICGLRLLPSGFLDVPAARSGIQARRCELLRCAGAFHGGRDPAVAGSHQAIAQPLTARPGAPWGADGFLAGAKGSQWTFIPRKQST